MRRLFVSLAIAACAAIGSAQAFPLPPWRTVVEYYNSILGHYFMTNNPREMRAIDEGEAGPGWVKTGYSFAAFSASEVTQGVPVYRFYGTPGLGPNSHFFTADAAEAEHLKRPDSGWTFEQIAFRIDLPDPVSGTCTSGKPVSRFYNSRWMFNDSNHRYTSSPAPFERMKSRGWVAEGTVFCTDVASDQPLKSFVIQATADPEPLIEPSPICEDQTINLGPCVALNNHAPPIRKLEVGSLPPSLDGYSQRTGLGTSVVYTMPTASQFHPSERSFVQLVNGGFTLGLHLSTIDRGEVDFTSLNPLFQFITSDSGDPATDRRFFPFRADYDTDTQLVLSFNLNVKMVRTLGNGSHAYGHPTIEFIDTSTGRFLYFTLQTYGTVAPGDAVLHDVITRKVIVSTVFRPDALYGTSTKTSFIGTPPGFLSPNFAGTGGQFEFRMDHAGFQGVLDAARQLEPGLSASPSDYIVRNFHFNNEVVGDGEIGVNLSNYEMRLERR